VVTIPGIFNADITIQHEVMTDSGTTDSHGNEIETYATAVTRQVIAVYPLHRLPHHDVVSAEYVARTMLDFIIEVPDASIYKKNDRITLYGLKFLVQGFPFNWGGNNPFGLDTSIFGGSIHVERVT
jgi:hypothetical protein